ncbi:MAG: hypothetical protein Q8N51_01050 [Gammaproteobacteria bacterium]|nr:hypothetical protein [Gammaproteobacteria bacterium]
MGKRLMEKSLDFAAWLPGCDAQKKAAMYPALPIGLTRLAGIIRYFAAVNQQPPAATK